MITALTIIALILFILIGVSAKSDDARRKRELEDAEMRYYKTNTERGNK